MGNTLPGLPKPAPERCLPRQGRRNPAPQQTKINLSRKLELAENPHRVGKPLLEPLAPQYSARRGEYRVLYLIEDEQVTIIITSVTHRADAYRTQ